MPSDKIGIHDIYVHNFVFMYYLSRCGFADISMYVYLGHIYR